MITQQEYMVLKHPIRHLNIKIDLLNKNDVIVGSFEGIAIDGNVTLTSDSNCRRTGNITMVLDKKYNLLPSPSSKIWFNSRLGLWAGLKNFNDEILWFNLGKFAIDEINLSFNTLEKTISCNLVDYCAFIDGTLGGYLSHQTRIVSSGVTINEAIRTTLTSLGKLSMSDIVVNGSLATVPFEIEKSPNSTVYELVKELVDLYKNYDMYYDEEGVFRIEQIRNRQTDPVIWNFEDINLSVDYSSVIDFKNVKNSIWVWGRTESQVQVVWNYRNRFARNTISEMNSITEKQVNDICCVIGENKNSYRWTGSTWELLSFKVVPDFRMESIGEKILAVTDNNVQNVNQAKLRCEYELTNYSNFAEVVSFSCIPIYPLKPNDKIYLKVDELNIDGYFLVRSVDFTLGIDSLSKVTCQKIY